MRQLAILGSVALLFASIAGAQDEEARKHLLHRLGGPFIVYRTNVQEELKLSDDQKKKLLEKLPDYLQQTMKVLDAPLVGRPEIVNELKITNEQRHRFIGVVQEMQKNFGTSDESSPIRRKSGGYQAQSY